MTRYEPRDVSTARHKAAEEVREHVRSQLESWKRVPWLALEAYGDAGYSCKLQCAYLYGLWSIDLPQTCHPMRKLFIDCDSGEIVTAEDFRPGHYAFEPATDSEVLLLNVHKRDQMNTAFIIKSLRTAAETIRQRHDTSPTSESTRLLEWRRDIRESLRLDRVFVRLRKGSTPSSHAAPADEEARMAS